MATAVLAVVVAAGGRAAAGGTATASTDDLALILVLTFVVLVVYKEAVGTGGQPWQRALGRGLMIGIVPLGLAFALIVGVRLVHVLG
jgi:hypothetical protein